MYKICAIGQSAVIRKIVHNVLHQHATRTLVTCSLGAVHCPTCHSLQTRPLHTTISMPATRVGKSKKKIIKGVTFKKSVKSSWTAAKIYPDMTVAELAETLNKDVDDVFEALFYIPNTDLYDKPDSVIVDLNVIKQVCDKLGHRWKVESKKKEMARENKDVTRRPPPDPAVCVKRPPVVTIMGHVDHGKTTLLDAMRKSNIVDKEFGGITQHIGAFSVKLKSGEVITFIDTPGHAAFSSMRARGAKITDIVVLVVAADDGVMNQTMESFKHAQEAGVPIIVAINKIDKPGVDVDQTKEILLRHGIALEEHGGDIQAVPISALKGTNLDMLQEAIIALAELLEIKCDPTGPAEGAVIEAKTDPGKGRVATVLIQRGILNKGACLVAGTAWAKVRSMHDDSGRVMKKVSPGVAAELTGWKELPSAGDIVIEVKSESQAREVISWRLEEERLQKQQKELEVIKQKQEEHRQEYEELRREKLEKGIRRGTIYGRRAQVAEDADADTTPELSMVLKGDVDGTVEAILQLLNSYNCPHCQLNLLQYGVGAVSEQDIDMAESFGGVIYAFNVDVPTNIAKLAQEKGVKIYKHNVIYKLVDDLKERLQERVLPVQHHEVIGQAVVQEKFSVTVDKKKMFVAGCKCLKGTLLKDKLYKLVRDGETLIENEPLASLRHFKAEVSEIKEKQECGLMFSDHSIDPQPGDTIICYEPMSVVPNIEWHLNF